MSNEQQTFPLLNKYGGGVLHKKREKLNGPTHVNNDDATVCCGTTFDSDGLKRMRGESHYGRWNNSDI